MLLAVFDCFQLIVPAPFTAAFINLTMKWSITASLLPALPSIEVSESKHPQWPGQSMWSLRTNTDLRNRAYAVLEIRETGVTCHTFCYSLITVGQNNVLIFLYVLFHWFVFHNCITKLWSRINKQKKNIKTTYFIFMNILYLWTIGWMQVKWAV